MAINTNRKSHSSGAEGNCVEVADLSGQVGIRDSKHKEGPALTIPREAFSAFIENVGTRCVDECADGS